MQDSPKSLSQWLSHLETLHPETIELGLERIRTVANRLCLGKLSKTVITVGGTNGKGSTIEMLQCLLLASGQKVGCYTSPHLFHYTERVRIDGKQVSERDMCRAFEQVEQARGTVSLTYFEFGTLAAFVIFQKQPLDYVLLEVGLGGRLDAVNIIDADVAVLTTVGIDHQAWLGDNREAIGLEKAAICRAGRPFFIGESKPPQSVLNLATDAGAHIALQNREFGFETDPKSNNWAWWIEEKGDRRSLRDLPMPSLPIQNASLVLAVYQFLGFKLAKDAISEVMENVSLTGRYQRISAPKATLLDVAHNPQAASYLADRLQANLPKGRIVALISVLNDKQPSEMVSVLAPLVDNWHVFEAPSSRVLPKEALAKVVAEETGKEPRIHSIISTGLHEIYSQMSQQDLLLVFGSFFAVAAALDVINQLDEINPSG